MSKKVEPQPKKILKSPPDLSQSGQVSKVPHRPDAQDAERNALTVKIEGDSPYARTLYINEVRFLLGRTAEAIVEIGKRLLVIKEKEKGSFLKIVEEEIGIPYRTAFRFMNTAIKSEKYPTITCQFGKSQLYTLLEASDEDLKDLEEKGVLAGKDMDELATLSVKEMRNLVRELKADTAKIVDEAVSTYKSQNDLLKKELDDFLKIVPLEKKNASRSEKRLLYAQAKYDQFEAALSVLAFNMMEAEDIKIGAKIEGLIKTCLARLLNLGEQWEKHKKGAAR